MSFSHRMVTLAAVMAIPVGIAATSSLLADDPETPEPPPAVELDSDTSPGTAPGSSPATMTPLREARTPPRPPAQEVAPRPQPTDGFLDDQSDAREEHDDDPHDLDDDRAGGDDD